MLSFYAKFAMFLKDKNKVQSLLIFAKKLKKSLRLYFSLKINFQCITLQISEVGNCANWWSAIVIHSEINGKRNVLMKPNIHRIISRDSEIFYLRNIWLIIRCTYKFKLLKRTQTKT